MKIQSFEEKFLCVLSAVVNKKQSNALPYPTDITFPPSLMHTGIYMANSLKLSGFVIINSGKLSEND